MKFNGINHYDFMGVSGSGFINNLPKIKNLESLGLIQVPYGMFGFNDLMKQKLFVFKIT